MPSTTITAAQVASISIALLASGGNATMSLFDIPELQSQPASRSLPLIRWLFSRGSHIFPQAAFISGAGFAYLAYGTVKPGTAAADQLLEGGPFSGYVAAALFTLSIAPFTIFAMIPTNFALIKLNEEKGGFRSAESARQAGTEPGQRSAEDSVRGKSEAAEFTDLSGPQSRTTNESTREDDEKVKQLLNKFALLNGVRAVLLGVGGVVGLLTALTS